MSTENIAPAENGLQSQFAILRALPKNPRRELLPGLQWRQGAWRLAPLGALAALFLLFPLLIFTSIQTAKSPPTRTLVQARVMQSEVVANELNSSAGYRFLKYRFQVKGREFTGNALAQPNSPLNSLRVGDELPVRFDARDARKNAPDEKSAIENFPWPILLMFPLMALFFFAPFVWPSLKVWFLGRHLCAKGHLAQGNIEWIRPRATSPFQGSFSNSYDVFYRWTNSGEMREGTMLCDNAWLVQQWKTGTPVIVAYDLKRPARNVLLEPFVR